MPKIYYIEECHNSPCSSCEYYDSCDYCDLSDEEIEKRKKDDEIEEKKHKKEQLIEKRKLEKKLKEYKKHRGKKIIDPNKLYLYISINEKICIDPWQEIKRAGGFKNQSFVQLMGLINDGYFYEYIKNVRNKKAPAVRLGL